MRFEFENCCDDGNVQVDVYGDDGERLYGVTLTRAQAELWKSGKSKIHRASGWTEPLTADSLTADADDPPAELGAHDESRDRQWLEDIGIETNDDGLAAA